jgi:hypothetical protein
MFTRILKVAAVATVVGIGFGATSQEAQAQVRINFGGRPRQVGVIGNPFGPHTDVIRRPAGISIGPGGVRINPFPTTRFRPHW